MGFSETYENILASMRSGIVAADVDGNIDYINPKALQILDLSPASAINLDIEHLLPEAGKLFKQCRQTGDIRMGNYVARGNQRLVIDAAPIRVEGKIEGVIATLHQLEDFKNAIRFSEDYLKLSKQLDAIFKGSSDGLWVHDSSGIIININTVSEMINGIRAKDVIGKSIYDLIDEGVFEGVVTPEILRTKRQFSTLSYNKKTQKRVLVTGTPILDEGGNVSLIVSNERDLTHWNAVKADLERSRKVAEKYKDEFEELSLLESGQPEIVAESKEMKQVLRIGMKLARMGASNILIQGESGTGKGLLARFIHDNGKRNSKPFIQINCAALPESLLEAELFGYEKGAFTGAREQGKIGLFELAHEGTLFLDEIGDLPLSVQAKLLKYLDDQEILPLGGIQRKKVDCCVIAATNRDLEQLTEQEHFRKDLFFRLNTFRIHIPPLRRRPVDVIKMTEYFLDAYNKEYQVQRRISPEAKLKLQGYRFPGNVRELQNIIKNAVVLSERDLLDEIFTDNTGFGQKMIAGADRTNSGRQYPLRLQDKITSIEKEILSDAITRFRSTRKIAQNLGTSQSSVMRKMKKYNLNR
ncbi:Response regulator of zinc sigma-54-dependent two-component system [Olavius sp. associated proteobacterium Delta 1]|nr:Response regulator of zinc sigma-54-dependent two-component system [Olavius sp. associated proteobacterium Delta 1]